MLLALLACTGCVSVRASTRPGADLARYRTFAWQAPASRREAAFAQSPAGDLVRARISRALAARGIRESDDHPDFVVAYRTRLETKREIGDWGYPAYFWGPPGPVTVDEYTEGALIIDFVDARSGRIFWTGAAAAVIDGHERRDMRKIVTAVDEVMKRYPSPVRSLL